MTDANIRMPRKAKDRLARAGGGGELSLRAFLTRLAQMLLTPAERAERAEKARAALQAWNGYALTPAEERDLDRELDRRLARASAP
jgi:hypothetical protein